MKIKCMIEPIPAPRTNARAVASVGVRDEIARWSLNVSFGGSEKEDPCESEDMSWMGRGVGKRSLRRWYKRMNDETMGKDRGFDRRYV